MGIIDHAELKICEKTESLQERFRKIVVTLKDPVTRQPDLPESWLQAQHNQRVVEFFDNQYQAEVTEGQIKSLYPACVDIAVSGLSLREIFLVLAKQYKIPSLNGNGRH